MKNIFHIASLELKRMKRNQMAWFVVLISAFLLFLMNQFNYFSIEEQFKMIKDFSLGIMNIIGLLLVVYFPVSLIQDDIKEKTIFSILSTPVSKTSLLLGKALAFAILLLLTICINTISLIIILKMKGAPIEIDIFYAVLMIYLKNLTLTGYAFIFAVLPLSSFISIFLTFFVFCLGTVKTYFESMLANYVNIDFPFIIQKITFVLIPNLKIFDVVEKITIGKSFDIKLLYFSFLHFVGISMLTYFLATIMFEKQEL